MTLGLLEFFWGGGNAVSAAPVVVVVSKGSGKSQHHKSSYQMLSEEFWLEREHAMTNRIPQPDTPAISRPHSYYVELQQTLDTAIQAKSVLQNQLHAVTNATQLKDTAFKLKQISALIVETTSKLNWRP